MADIAKVSSEKLILVRKNNSNPFEKYMPYVKTDEATGKRTWYIDGKNTNIEVPTEIPNNEQVTAFHDACMWYTMLGNGILQGVYNECQASLANGKFYISSGMIMFGGRLIEIGKNSQVEVDCSNFGDNATFCIKLEMTINEDDAKSDVGIYATADSSEKTNCLNGAGTYDIILFRVNGTNVNKVIPTLEPGIAQNATNLLGGGRIAGVRFSDVFKEQNGKVVGVKYATEAEVCAEARGFEGGDKNRVNENLYLPGRGVYLLQEAVLVKSRDILVRGKYGGGSSDWIPFENSNSLSKFEKAYAVLFKADNWDFTDLTPTANFLPNGGRILEVYKNTKASIPIYHPNDSNKIEIDIPNKQVRITGRAVDAAFTYKNATIRAYVFGGY